MALRKYKPSGDASSVSMAPLNLARKVPEKVNNMEPDMTTGLPAKEDVDIDLREIYFLIMHFLSAGPCKRTYGQFWNELLEHQLLPRRYHAWYSRSGVRSGDEDDDGKSLPMSYVNLVERYPHIEKDHLVKLLKQLIEHLSPELDGMIGGAPSKTPVVPTILESGSFSPKKSVVPTILGSGSFSLLQSVRDKAKKRGNPLPGYLRWPHMQADQVRGLSLREIGGGFTKHHRAPSVRAACYAIAKPSTMVQKMQVIKRLRGHQNAVYCAIFDRLGQYVITGSDDRLVKIWSMETAFCLASCRGHEGDITDLAVSSNNALVASSSNDFIIRVWRLPDGLPISVLRGHAGAVTAIAFSPRPSAVYQLLSSSDDGTCRIWDARHSNHNPRIYVPKPPETPAGKSNEPSSSVSQQTHQILCCAYNANGTVFVTGSSDTYARVWNACKTNPEDSEQPNHEMDLLSGHENDVNYVQFSGCAVACRSSTMDAFKEDNLPKFKNSWFTHDNIVTCSRDGSAIIWIPRSRRSHGKVGRWTRFYHLKVPPPPMPPQPTRGGPRQRFQPTPRGVNMIVWSLDNRFVLAAIMDCRICVWNASDGSLVHSLIGHSESTFVLDVHPFNPRIAMSAGYDGKTIIWDIWEGTPIRIYETGRFKLVDGKFSPDGTSIVLSDEVGQIFIIATGQGESQKDAKYDQFFLGDYRPLIQDTNGNVLDQETQLVPYRRNMQDLLCDSSLIPYPDDYQNMFQQRRLGILGTEWRPSSVKFAVGPTYNANTGDYQMLPILDLDRWVEPVPEFLDAIDWEQENEVQTDDNDSEYNVTDEYSSEGGHEILSCSSSEEDECSAEDSGAGNNSKEGLRRSKRKKHISEVEFTTSSGRRVKKRNLDERDGTTLSRAHKKQRSRNGQLASRKKISKSKALRPQRRAARNALNLFSKIGGSSDGEDDEDSQRSSSESESELPDSNTQSIESEGSLQSREIKDRRGKEVFRDEYEDVKTSQPAELQPNAGIRRRLVLKLPFRDPKAIVASGNVKSECSEHDGLEDSFAKANSDVPNLKKTYSCLLEPEKSLDDAVDAMLPENGKVTVIGQAEKSDKCNLSASYSGSTIRWGEVKARSSKRLKVSDTSGTDAWPPPNSILDDPRIVRSDANGHLRSHDEHGILSNSENQVGGDNLERKGRHGLDGASTEECPEYICKLTIPQQSSSEFDQQDQFAIPVPCNGNITETVRQMDEAYQDSHGISEPRGIDEPLKGYEIVNNKSACTADHNQDMEKNSLKFRIKSNGAGKATNSSSSKLKSVAVEDCRSSEHDLISDGSPPTEQNMFSVAPEEDEGTSGQSPGHSDWNNDGSGSLDTESLDTWTNKSHYSRKRRVDSHKKMYNAVYERSKSSRGRKLSARDVRGADESVSNSNNHGDAMIDGARRTRSMGTKPALDEFPMTSNSSLRSVGLRSARNRRENCNVNLRAPDKRKCQQSGRSWLMLSEHEQRYRYIPQQGDEVAYLRQGHEEYAKNWRLQDAACLKIRGLKAVEFCKVQKLDYSTLPGSGESCCKLILEFLDPSSNGFGKTFQLTLPDLSSPEFIVERTRYDAAIERNWSRRDKCQVWWDDDKGGSWWEGRIVNVKAKSPDFPDSPWDRYVIQYRGDSTEEHPHSPWELNDASILWEQPHIDEDIRDRLLSCIKKLESNSGNKDKHGIRKLNLVAQKSEFLNRFPVPLSLDTIKKRLENNYYRTLEAVKHDASVMMSNAESFFGKNTEMVNKMRRLREWVTQTFLSL